MYWIFTFMPLILGVVVASLSRIFGKPEVEKPVLSPEWAEYVRNIHVSDLKWLEKQLHIGLEWGSGHKGHAVPMAFFELVRVELAKRQNQHDDAWWDLIDKTEAKIALITAMELVAHADELLKATTENQHPAHWYGPFWTVPDGKWEYVSAGTTQGPIVYYRTGRRA